MAHLKNRLIGSVVVLAMLAVVGCNQNVPGDGNGGDGGDDLAPKIPPQSTFVIELEDFEDANSNGDVGTNGMVDVGTNGAIERGNWLYAGGTTFVWNVILTVNLVVPVAAFVESFNHQPTLGADGIWRWQYDFRVFSINHSAELQGQINGATIDWNMFLTKEGEYTDYNWFSGQSNILGTSGTWSLNRDPSNPSPFIQIEWNHDEETGENDIRYTNVIPDSDDNGGYIFYGVNNETPYNAFYEIYPRPQDATTEMEWNRETKEGRVKDPAYYGDDEYRCWDDALIDTECPEDGA
ncbi:MAG: hypothetical protein R3E58_03895 [Phycisphaerae bacterium]